MDDPKTEAPRLPRRLLRLGSPERAAYVAGQRERRELRTLTLALAFGAEVRLMLDLAAAARAEAQAVEADAVILREHSPWWRASADQATMLRDRQHAAMARAVVSLLQMLAWAPPVACGYLMEVRS